MIRYLLADLLKSQRFLPPVLLYAASLSMLHIGDTGSTLAPYGASAMLLFPIAAWLTVVVVNNEDPIQRRITLAAVGGWLRLLGGLLGLSTLCNGVLVLLAVAVPLLLGGGPFSVSFAGTALVAHLIGLLTGLGFGLLCARPIVPTTGWSLVAMLAVLAVVLMANQVPPIGPTARLMFAPHPTQVAAVLSVQLAVAVTLLVVTVTVTYLIGRRRF